MRLSNTQAMMLLDIAKWSLSFVGGAANYSEATIHKLVNDIMNQQSKTLIDLEEE